MSEQILRKPDGSVVVRTGDFDKLGMNECWVTSAYGAKYVTVDEVLTAWNEGKDFKIYNGPYCSSRDCLRLKMGRFTHVCFVFQDTELRTHGHYLEL